jgi:hypothetical protein
MCLQAFGDLFSNFKQSNDALVEFYRNRLHVVGPGGGGVWPVACVLGEGRRGSARVGEGRRFP